MLRSRSHCRMGAWVVCALFRKVSKTKRLFAVLVGKCAAGLRSARSTRTTKNSACCPLAVCSTTQGAILLATASPSDGGLATLTEFPPARCGIASPRRVDPPALEEATAATNIAEAATRNNEQKIRRHGVDVNVRSEFVIIELPFGLSGCK